MRYLIILVALVACSKPEPPAAIGPVPSPPQLAWHDMEMNAFVHFTTNTFTNREWGYGDESPSVFQPTAFDADQWVQTFKETGFQGVILTCKHHDGFCLWPSQYTNHSVKSSPWRNGKGDVVAEVATACKKHGLKFGIYVSPWDRNHPDYGSPVYVTYYRNQLTELFTNYGPLFEMWFDGANGGDGYYGGKREKRSIQGSTYYDWPTTLDLVRGMEPNIIFFSDAGPGVRWVGNERGIAGETNWNTITPDTLFAGKGGIEKLLNTGDEHGTAWIPAEVDVSIRPGWFYHASEDSLVKTPEDLFSIYMSSVGRGSTLLLNVPPDRRGLLHEKDVASLQGFRKLLDERLGHNLINEATLTASNTRGRDTRFSVQNLIDTPDSTYWATDDGIHSATLDIAFTDYREVHYLVLAEYLPLGQRVKSFTIETVHDNESKPVFTGTTIGHKRIIPLQSIRTKHLRVRFTDARASLVLSGMAVY
ncbi:MAG TPA: alpha-L-fucosidase [Cyclobacteriaceae bacterium]|nr:alpha-L-fucosidase [Cyclobacteriaceae bacterium]